MPTSLGIMHTLAGPPPPPCDGCWPTPHETTTATSAASRVVETTFSFRAEPNILPPSSSRFPFLTSKFPLTRHVLLLALTEELVQEHGHEEQDTQYEELPGAWHAGQDQAVPERRDDEDAEHRAPYRPRAPVDASPPENDGGDHVELQPQAGVGSGRVDPRGVDHRRHRHQQPDARVKRDLDPPDGNAREPGRLLVVADGVDVASEAGAGQYYPHRSDRHDEEDELPRHRPQVRLPEVGRS